jgi:hypothetical protein
MKVLPKKLYCSKVFIAMLIYLFTCANTLLAQVNLIPDPSFEDTITTQKFYGQRCLHHWKNLDSTRIENCAFTYFHFNSADGNFQLPHNSAYYQYPKSGFGFIDIGVYWIQIWSPPGQSVRSLPRARLLQKLNAGKKYCAKAWLAPIEMQDWYNNGFGMYFDNGQLDTIVAQDSSGIYPFVTPQVQVQYVVKDTQNWNLVSGTFIANGTEQYVNLGNFLSDANTIRDSMWPGQFNLVCDCSDFGVDQVSCIPTDIANWLRDTSVAQGDSVYIGLPKYEVPDAVWYTYNMVLIDTASGIWVTPTQAVTRYIQAIDVCDRVAYDTVVVRNFPLGIGVSPPFERWALSVYPNPASDVIQVSNIMGDKVGLYNTVGQLVAEQKVMQNKATIQVGHLPKGVYVVKTAGQVAKVVIR